MNHRMKFSILLLFIFVNFNNFFITEAANVDEAYQFSNSIIVEIEELIQGQLPPEANAEATVIFDQIKIGLTNCEGLITVPTNLSLYNECANSLRMYANSALGGLKIKYSTTTPRPTSSASSISLYPVNIAVVTSSVVITITLLRWFG
ncbi:uncharacterized protein LOC106091690 [Stomoxys calcitrans]|uniref:uncharacterized protein LOC106091690 n=1 Tax=Stomoxys calcitrans TaxID=35570 RepID=UPI0027E371B7|nr:uncharacterized protein LOC106091690 [Stomoxys calcitrans]